MSNVAFSWCCSESSEPQVNEAFQSLWHYGCVLSSQCDQKLLNSPRQASPAFFLGSTIGCPTSDLSNDDQNASSAEGFAISSAKHHLHPLFRMLDENNDGKVTLDEMMCVLRKLGNDVSGNYLVSLMEPLDSNGDMAVDFAEFIGLYQSICSIGPDASTQEEGTQLANAKLDSGEYLDTFNVYDKNRDGYISAAELAEVLRDLGFPEGADLQKCQTLIDRVDSDGNGLVDLGEFKQMLHRGCGFSETRANCESCG